MSFVQSDFYDVDTIKERLSEALTTEEWENIKESDVGQALLAFGANVVHQEGMAFYTGFDQFFKSTVTQKGYLEAIAKGVGVVPKTYNSASLSVTLSAISTPRTYGPLDFSAEVSGTRFYNLDDITIGTSSTTIVLYEGAVNRVASEAGSTPFYSWSYAQMPAPIPVLVGSQVVRRYILLPDSLYVDSLIIESTTNLNTVPVAWRKVDSWFEETPTSKAFLIEKDYLGRYKVVFGDGIYGTVYPTDEVVIARYLISSGADAEVGDFDETNIKLYNQDTSEITSLFSISSVFDFTAGLSEIDFDDLSLEIDQKQSSRGMLMRMEEYENYLESRSDIRAAVVVAERDSTPPNIEYFNTVRYAGKPTTEGVDFNNTDIQNHIAKYGMETVDFMKVDPQIEKFNVTVLTGALSGYSISSVNAAITSILTDVFSWDELGFKERVDSSRIYSLISDVEGLDLSQVDITVQSIYTDNDTGDIEFDHSNTDVIYLSFVPRRYKIYSECDEYGSVAYRRDNGLGELYGDMVGTEQFNYVSTDMTGSKCFEQINDMLIFGDEDGTALRLVDLRNTEGSVSTINFQYGVLAFTWDTTYQQLITVQENAGTYYFRAYVMPDELFEVDSYNFLQLNPAYTPSIDIGVTVTPPTNTDGVNSVTYYNDYIYVHWHLSTGSFVIRRYRVTSSTIDTYDTTWATSGDLTTSTKAYYGADYIENIFDDEDVLWLASDSGIDAIRDFATLSPTYDGDFLSDTTEYQGIVADNDNKVLYLNEEITGNYKITKRTSITVGGSATSKDISDTSLDDIRGIGYHSYENSIKVYFYDATEFKLYYVLYDTASQAPIARAGLGTTGTTNSIQKVADIDYPTRKITFADDLTTCIIYTVPEDDVEYTLFQMPALNSLVVAENV